MKKFIIALIVVIVLVGILALILFNMYVSRYDNLVRLQENANGGRSQFAAAVNTCSQKMKSVWTMADQEGILEKETYVEVARARSAYEDARKNLEKAEKNESSSIFDLTKLGSSYGQALVNVRVAFEAYPQLRTSETYQRAMIAMETGFNEIKTALDDWIVLCRNYNTYRKSFMVNWFAKTFGWEFPEGIAYYEGGIKEPEQVKVTAEELNPRVTPSKPTTAPAKNP